MTTKTPVTTPANRDGVADLANEVYREDRT